MCIRDSQENNSTIAQKERHIPTPTVPPPSIPIPTTPSVTLQDKETYAAPRVGGKCKKSDQSKRDLPFLRSQKPPAYRLRSHSRNLATPFKQMAVQSLITREVSQQFAHHIYDDKGKRLTLDSLLKGSQKEIWDKALSNELGRLTKGNKYNVDFTECMKFIPYIEVPTTSKVTYANFVCDHRPLKTEPWRVRLVVGGDKLNYLEDTASPTTTLLETKILVNSVISDAKDGARFFSCDLKDFFLATPMKTPEYMKIHRRHIPADIFDQYNIASLLHHDYVYCKITKGMYGLKQAAILAYENLCKKLHPTGYRPIVGNAGIFYHIQKPTKFCFCVDDFGIKYYNKQDAQHLLDTLGKHYKYSVDWTGNDFCGLHYDWNYE